MNILIKDETINQTNGVYSRIKKILEDESPAKLEKWVIETQVGISNAIEDSFLQVKFWNNGECILIDYYSSFTSEYNPIDLLFFYEWLKNRGWKLVIDDDLRNLATDYWSSFDHIVADEEFVSIEGDDNDDDDDYNFLEYKNKMVPSLVPTAGKYDATEELPEFRDHKYDLNKRNEEEKALF